MRLDLCSLQYPPVALVAGPDARGRRSEKSQLDQELIAHKKDREAARADLAQATQIREKEHAEYVEFSGEQRKNVRVERARGRLQLMLKFAGSGTLALTCWLLRFGC